jgi:ribose transport system permease protein
MNHGYLGRSNLLILFKSVSITGIIGIGISCLLISGQVDLSASSVAVLAGVLIALILKAGLPWPLAMLLGLLCGCLCGVVTSLLVLKLNMMSFIATIGLSSIWQGVAYLFTRANPVKYGNVSFQKLGSITVFGFIPLMFIIMIALMYHIRDHSDQHEIRQEYVHVRREQGRRAAGGLKTPQDHDGAVYQLRHALIAGRHTFNLQHAQGRPDAALAGDGRHYRRYSRRNFFHGRQRRLGGLFIGLMLLNAFSNGLTVIQVASYWQIFAQGALLILALMVDFYREKSRVEALKASASAVAAAKRTAK